MAMRSAVETAANVIVKTRRSIIEHLVRQTGGPTADPRDALRLARTQYGLAPREAAVGRFTARISRLESGQWALDFHPDAPRLELVCAIWHELAELLCLSDDFVSFEGFSSDLYRESAISAYDRRHLCAAGVERFVWMKLGQLPEVKERLRLEKVQRILQVRNTTAPIETVLPSIIREPWFDDERPCDRSDFSL